MLNLKLNSMAKYNLWLTTTIEACQQGNSHSAKTFFHTIVSVKTLANYKLKIKATLTETLFTIYYAVGEKKNQFNY